MKRSPRAPRTMPPVDRHRTRRLLLDGFLVLLLPAVVALAFGALRGGGATQPAAAVQPTAARPTVAPPATAAQSRAGAATAGAVWAGGDGRVLVALTSGDCLSGGKAAGRIMRRLPGRTFQPAGTVPLAEVTAVDVTASRTVHATGRDAQCHRAHVVTTDGGRTWSRAARLDKLAVVDHAADGSSWGITASGNAQVVRSTGTAFEVVAYPCPANLAAPRFVAAVDARTAWVVCSASHIRGHQARLLYGTADGGRTWHELAGAWRSASGAADGLDADGDLRSIGFTDARHGWVTVVTEGCRVGEVRVTADSGRTWTATSCPSAAGAPVERVFGVTFRDARRAVLVGIGTTGEEAYETADGGRTWRRAT